MIILLVVSQFTSTLLVVTQLEEYQSFQPFQLYKNCTVDIITRCSGLNLSAMEEDSCRKRPRGVEENPLKYGSKAWLVQDDAGWKVLTNKLFYYDDELLLHLNSSK